MASEVIGNTVLDPLMRITPLLLCPRAGPDRPSGGSEARAARRQIHSPRGKRSNVTAVPMAWIFCQSTQGGLWDSFSVNEGLGLGCDCRNPIGSAQGVRTVKADESWLE